MLWVTTIYFNIFVGSIHQFTFKEVILNSGKSIIMLNYHNIKVAKTGDMSKVFLKTGLLPRN